MRMRRCFAGMVLLFLAYGTIEIAGAEEAINLDQLRHRAWRASDGWFDGVVHSLAQGSDGYLWIGTDSGVYRFDGVKFEPVLRGDHRPIGATFGLLAAQDGSMWIASASGLSVWRDAHLTDIAGSGDYINSVYQDRSGNIWFTRGISADSGPVCRLRADNTPQCFNQADGIATHYAQKIVQDAEGFYWIAAGTLTRWKPGSKGTEYFAKELSAFGTGWGLQTILIDSDGSLLAGLTVTGPTAGLQRFKDHQWSAVRIPGFDGSKRSAQRLFRDSSGSLWIDPVMDPELVRLTDNRFEHFTPANGLTSDAVGAIIEDREGTIWIGTDMGIDSFTRPAVLTYWDHDGSPLRANTLLSELSGSLLIGTPPVMRISGNRAEMLPLFKDDSIVRTVNAMFVDHKKRLWVAVYDTITMTEGGKRRTIADTNGLSHLASGDIVKSIAEDSNQVIWAYIVGKEVDRLVVLSPSGLTNVRIDPKRDRLRWLVADHSGGLWIAGLTDRLIYLKDGQEKFLSIPHVAKGLQVNEMVLGPDETLLISSTQGLVTLKDDRWRAFGAANGLDCASIDSTVVSDDGAAWLSTRCGLMRVSAEELRQQGEPYQSLVTPKTYGTVDGWSPTISIAGNKSAKTNDGRLWFASMTSLKMIDPNHLATNRLKPPLAIESIHGDRRLFARSDMVMVPPKTAELQIDYTALSLVEPKTMNFKYRLVGHDADWQDPGTRRQAFYNDLTPGRYTFEVIASNNDGVWNTDPASVELNVLPTFFQTLLFKLICAVAIAATLWGAYLLRIRQVTRVIQLTHRERALERESIARDLHDTFFQTMQSLFLRFHSTMIQLPESDTETRGKLDVILRDSDRAMAEGRKMFLETPLIENNDVELGIVFERIAAEFSTAYGIACSVTRRFEPRAIRPSVIGEAYKLGREALYNAFRHANASAIEVIISYGADQFTVSVKDDGRGFDLQERTDSEASTRWGLKNMALRAKALGGNLHIVSHKGRGTVVELVLPAALSYRD